VRIVLAATYHDPDGRLQEQSGRLLPILQKLFSGIAIQASSVTMPEALAPLAAAGVQVSHDPLEASSGLATVGRSRLSAVGMALAQQASTVLYVDWDRALHWAEIYPEELKSTLDRVVEYDCLVVGRSERAFTSHPRFQTDTEAIINHLFAVVSGNQWDVTAATRGLSRRAAEAILAGCADQEVSVDVSWPLFLQHAGSYSLGYLATEGMEFETADRYSAEIAAAGGRDRWIAALERDPRHWAHRLHLAQIEVAALAEYCA